MSRAGEEHLRALARVALEAEVCAAMGDAPPEAFAQASVERALLRAEDRRALADIQAREQADLVERLQGMLQQVKDHAEKIGKQ